MVVPTIYPALVPAIQRAGHTPVVCCPRCGAAATMTEEQGEVRFACEPCLLGWSMEEDIDKLLVKV